MSLSLNFQSLLWCCVSISSRSVCPSLCHHVSVSLTAWISQSLSLALSLPASLPLYLCFSHSEPLSLLDTQQTNIRARACPGAPTSGITAGDRLCQQLPSENRPCVPSPALCAGVPGAGTCLHSAPAKSSFLLPSSLSWTETQCPHSYLHPLKNLSPGCEPAPLRAPRERGGGTLWRQLHPNSRQELTGQLG